MTWLVAIGLSNALLALLLAPLALAVGRWLRRPALAHLLWIVVLCKLLTPPAVRIPLDDWLGRPSGWLADAAKFISAFEQSPAGEAYPAPADETGQLLADRSSRSVMFSGVFDASPLERATAANSQVAQPSPAALARRASDVPPRSVSPRDWLALIAIVWLAGSAAISIRMVRRGWRFHRFLKQAGMADPSLQSHIDQLARRAGLAKAPRVVLVRNVVSPLLWGPGPIGFGRGATLVFPAPLASRLDAASCDTLLLHELAHYARGDGWVRLLELIVQILYWWHPLAWLARREIEAAEEACCDGWVLAQQNGSRRLYAEALLAAVDFLHEPSLAPLPPAACGLGDAALLRWRLTQIMCGEVASSPSRMLKLLVFGAAVLVLPVAPGFFGNLVQRAVPRVTASQRDRPISVSSTTPTAKGKPRLAASVAATTADKGVGIATLPSATPIVPPTLWATATSPSGKFQLQARTGRKTTLVHVDSGWRLDLSAHQIACASFSPDGRIFATGHDDSIVRVWDCETGGLVTSLRGSEAAICSVAFAPDGARVAAGAADGSALVWDWAHGDELAHLARHDAPVSCLRWSKSGQRLAIGFGRWADGDSGAIALWSPVERFTPELHDLPKPVGALAWLVNDESLLIAGWDGQASYFSVSSLLSVGSLELDKLSVSAATWSPDCSLVAPWQAEQLVAAFGLWRESEPGE